MILVVGATGELGSAIVRRLLGRGEKVRALVRKSSDASRVQELRGAGAETVEGDLKDPASLQRACASIEAVVTTANSARRGPPDTVETVDDKGNAALVEAAKKAGVRRFVFVSALGADEKSPVPFLAAKGKTEQRVRESGIEHTIFEPNIYMEVWVGAVVLGPAMQGQEIRYVGGDRKHAFISQEDVADFVVAALRGDAAKNRTVVLGGPAAVSWNDICVTVERVMGKPLRHRSDSPEELNLPPTMVGLIAALDTFDSPVPMTETARTFGVRQRTLEETLRGMLQPSLARTS